MIEGKPVRVLFSGHDFKFLTPFIDRIRQNEDYEVRLEQHRTHEINSEKEALECGAWAEIIFCEWAMGNAVWHSRHKRQGQLLVVRLHLQEVQARAKYPFIDNIDWEKVDRLILICQHMHDFMVEEFPILRQGRACLIYNPIDAQVALDRPKLPGAEFNLGLVGIVPQRKRLDRAVDTLLELKKHDSRFTLFIKGRRPEEFPWMKARPEELAWYAAIDRKIEASPQRNSIVFEPHGGNMPLWYSKIGFILSPSDFEGSHQSIAEGMAAGSIPVIFDWAGADRIYPPRYVVGGVGEAAQAVLKWKTPKLYHEEMDYCRAYAKERFDQRGICDRLESIFTQHIRRGQAGPIPAAPAAPLNSRPQVMILGYLPVGFRGGYRIRIEQEIKALTKHGCDVRLACLHPEAPADKLEAHRRELETLGGTVHLAPCKRFFDIRIDAELMREELDALERLVKETGTRIVQTEALYSTRLGLLLKRRCPGLRLVFDCHGASPEEERLSGSHPARIAAMADWEKQVLAGTDLNVFVSAAMNDYYLKKYGFNDLAHVIIPCCVAEERFPPPEAPASALDLPADRPIVVYLGTLAAWQCGEETIRLFAQWRRYDPRIFFLILAPRGDHKKTREMMARHELPEDAAALTELPHDQVAAALRQAHAGVLLRRADPVNLVSSPTKFGEYLAAGLPVIMTDGIGDFSALAAESGLGLLLDAALLELAEYPPAQIVRLSEFVQESWLWRATVAARCRLAARERLHWDMAAARLSKAYGQLL